MIPYIYRTFKQDCEAKVKLCLSKDYQKLVVSKVNLDMHIVDKVSNTVPPNYIYTLTFIPYLNSVATIGLVSKINVASNLVSPPVGWGMGARLLAWCLQTSVTGQR